MLLRCIVYAKKERDVKVIDILNYFIQTLIKNKKDMSIIKFRGILVDMLLHIAPDVYGPYITSYSKGIKQQFSQCMNIIYGSMVESLL